MTVKGKILLFLALALGLVAVQGASLYQGTARGRIAREWSTRANDQRQLYTQLRGDALLYLDAVYRARRAAQPTPPVMDGQQARLKDQFSELRALMDGEEQWAQASRSDARQELSRLEEALSHWVRQTEARVHFLPLQAPTEAAPQQEALDAYRREVEPLLEVAIARERAEVAELSEQGDRNLRMGHTLSLVIPLTALGLLMAMAAVILIPMHRRFQELLVGAERLGRGEWGMELLDKRGDEFGLLSRAFNQMRHELQATQTRLIFADRLTTLGRLSAGVGHEINNPLTYVLSNIQYAQQELSQPGPSPSDGRRQALLEALDEAHKGAEQVRFIVQDLKVLSRAEDASPGRVDLASVVRSAGRMASHELAHRARLVEDCEGVPAVLGNPARLGQVFLNLIINAAQAMPQEPGRDNEIRVVARQEAPEYVTVEVSDTGRGIDPEHLGRIFEPFFTTKPTGQGTGLGLSVCRDILTAYGGSISVRSELGRGTTFRILLLAAPSTAVAS
jgi:two-component system, NtrC family, sensor kinase